MFRFTLILLFISIGLIDCEHYDVKGHSHLKGPNFWSSYKAKVIELPSPTIEHIAPVQQRLVLEKTHHIEPVQEKLVVEEKVHRIVEQPKIVEQLRIEEGVKGGSIHHETKSHHQNVVLQEHHHQENLHQHEQIRIAEQPKIVEQIRIEEGVKGVPIHHQTKSHHQNIILQEHNHHANLEQHHLNLQQHQVNLHQHHENLHQHHADIEQQHNLAHERRYEELHHQRAQSEQLKEIQHFQQIQQHEQIRQQLEQQKHLETIAQKTENCDKPAQIVQTKTNEHFDQIIQQKQERNEKLTIEEEAIAEPFPLIPKTSFTCNDKPVLPGLYADLETGCRVYHFCFAQVKKADIVEQIHQDRVDALHQDVHHVNSLLIHHPEPEQQQMKSFFCGEGTLFNQKLLICDHAVNVICPESIHYYSANLEFGKPSAEPAAQLVQQKEISKTNHIVQVREQLVQHPEPVQIVQHHDAIKIVEPPKPIVQVREEIVQHQEPAAKIVQEQVKIGHIVEEAPPLIVQQKTECINCKSPSNNLVHEDRFITTSNAGSFASSSNQDWKEDRSWSTSRTLWGSTNKSNETNKDQTDKSTNSNINASTNSSTSSSSTSISRNEKNEWPTDSNDNQQNGSINKAVNRRFLGELITSNIPQTKFTCEGKPFQNGLYADVEFKCQIYHRCYEGQKLSYACNRGTLFNQKNLSCDFAEKVKCTESEKYYTLNAEFN